MSIGTILLIILIQILLGALPSWPYSRGGKAVRLLITGDAKTRRKAPPLCVSASFRE